MEFKLILCTVIVQISLSDFVTGQIYMSTFDTVGNVKFNANVSKYLLKTFKTHEKLFCLNACIIDNSCVSLTFNRNNICSLYKKEILGSRVNANGDDLFIKSCM